MGDQGKTIIPVKVGPYVQPKESLKRFLTNHIPSSTAESANVFDDDFDLNMNLLIEAIEKKTAYSSSDVVMHVAGI